MGTELPSAKRKQGVTYAWFAVILAAVVVVALLLLSPAIVEMATYRRHSNQAQCASNEHILAGALLAYAADQDDRLPTASVWAPAVQPYIMSRPSGRGVASWYDCPAQWHPVKVPGIDWGEARGLSYAMSLGVTFSKVSDCQQPARTVVLFDSDTVPDAWPDQAAARHLEHGAIFAYLDGHVKWVPRSKIRKMPGGK